MTIQERYPYARCEQCGWMGRITELVYGTSAIDDICPECGLDDTTWMTAEEYVQELKETGHDDA
jgi:predicted RNA-binding Zn-ribbon protein involved in translation (DUF1610 family)